ASGVKGGVKRRASMREDGEDHLVFCVTVVAETSRLQTGLAGLPRCAKASRAGKTSCARRPRDRIPGPGGEIMSAPKSPREPDAMRQVQTDGVPMARAMGSAANEAVAVPEPPQAGAALAKACDDIKQSEA